MYCQNLLLPLLISQSITFRTYTLNLQQKSWYNRIDSFGYIAGHFDDPLFQGRLHGAILNG